MNARKFAQAKGSAQQRRIGNGLGNATIGESMDRGFDVDQALIDNAINEGVNQQRLGILSQYGQMGNSALGNYAQMGNANIGNAVQQRVGIVGSKTDQGPNASTYFDLLRQAGAQGGAGAGGNSGPKGGFVLNDNTGGGQQQGNNALLEYIQRLMGAKQGQGQGQNGGGFDFGGAFQGASNQPKPPAPPIENRMGGYGDQPYGPSAPANHPTDQNTRYDSIAQQLERQGIDTSGYTEARLRNMLNDGVGFEGLPRFEYGN